MKATKTSILIACLAVITIGSMAFSILGKEYSGKVNMLSSITSKQANNTKSYFINDFVNLVTEKNLNYSVQRRYSKRGVTKEQLTNAKTLGDIIPYYPVNWITNYLSVEISATENGKETKIIGQNDTINHAQSAMFQSVDLGAVVDITVNHKTKNVVTGKFEDEQMKVSMAVTPKKEARFPDGYDQLINYFKEHKKEKLYSKNPDKIKLSQIFFTVTKNGEIDNVELIKTSGDPEIDESLVNMIHKMPKWLPAENPQGLKVDQEFEFTLSVLTPAGC